MGKTIKVDVQGIDEVDLILDSASTSANAAESASVKQSDKPKSLTFQAEPEISSVATAPTRDVHGTNSVCPAIVPLQLSTGSTTLGSPSVSTSIASHEVTHMFSTDYGIGPTMNYPTGTQGTAGLSFNYTSSCGNITDGNSTRLNGTGGQTNCVAATAANISYAYAGTAGAELVPSPSAVPNLAQSNGWDFLLWTIVLLITVICWI